MKKYFYLFCWMMAVAGPVFPQKTPPIIPLPHTYGLSEGEFILDENVGIIAEKGLATEGHYLQKELFRLASLTLSTGKQQDNNVIHLMIDRGVQKGYELIVQNDRIEIKAGDNTGVFYGIISLLQLIQASDKEEGVYTLQTWSIQDQPAYDWRGLMLDESRHFFGVRKVKQILDWMAYYKLNKFHWHLTDAPGWRLEIKQFPKLALVGGVGNHTDPYAPASYYTQEEIHDIVRYAEERKIEIIPEIDMPGHATAANRAYPEYSGGGSERYPEFTFHPGKEETYHYLSNILKEVDTMFPSNLIHLGGDEVSFGNERWPNDPEVKKLMAKENLKDLKAVEDYFFQRMADSLFVRGNKVLAWDEMAGASLPKDKSVMLWWRHDKEEQLHLALENGYPTVICPRIPFYFDFVQEESHQFGRKWDGAYSPLQAVYEFDVEKFNVKPEQENLILGLQANVWTETIHNENRLDYMLFPRIAALSEAAWTLPEHRGFREFMDRLPRHLELYQTQGLYFYHPTDGEFHPEPIYRP
ncbi:beta-N-acetylhexosaminidase [Negadavirga shengliensis]|uniref:beta-N-acetylhexosaminidase n=1 Tax=Negadavirga shengliensis TaxID=1389218 RepID=A0ABV9T561_9BACT